MLSSRNLFRQGLFVLTTVGEATVSLDGLSGGFKY